MVISPQQQKNRLKQPVNGQCEGYFTNLTPDSNSPSIKTLNPKFSVKTVNHSQIAPNEL
jgi:hypothetical protein